MTQRLTVHFTDRDGALHSIWPAIERRDLPPDEQFRWAVATARKRGGVGVRFDVFDDLSGLCVMRGKVK